MPCFPRGSPPPHAGFCFPEDFAKLRKQDSPLKSAEAQELKGRKQLSWHQGPTVWLVTTRTSGSQLYLDTRTTPEAFKSYAYLRL